MSTKQQEEALNYFREHAGDWRAKSEGRAGAKVNIIEQRNNYVLAVAAERAATRTFLDVGCGTGELVCAAAQKGIDATGVDFASEMIALATRKATDEKAAGAKFVCSSIFDFPMGAQSYDLISANGLIEYISPNQTLKFFDLAAKALTVGGSFVVGSRNRLFNLISMNGYTNQEIENGSAELLLREAIRWTSAKNVEEGTAGECVPLQAADTRHARTGVAVEQRFQFSPCQLIQALAERGLSAVEVYPAHIHGVAPSFAKAHPETHVSIAQLLQASARHNTQLLPHASTFMLHVKKEI